MAEYATQPKAHRSGVTEVDSSDPPDTSGAINAKGYRSCRFDITVSGSGFNSLEVQVLFWNPRQSLWFGGSKYTFTEAGKHAMIAEAVGAIIFLKVTVFSGSSFSLGADYALS